MKEMIERKNNILRNGAEQFRNVGKLATMCKGIRFTTVEAADEFMATLANTLQRISYERFDLLEEANISEPEAEEGSLDDEERDQWNPGVVPPTEEEMAKAREVYGDD